MTTDRASGRRVRWGAVLAGVALLLVAWAVAVATAALAARGELRAAEDELRGARTAATELRIEDADAAFARADDHLAEARDRLERPDVVLASRLPGVGADLLAARAVAEGAELVSRAGGRVTGAVLSLPDGAASLLPRDGRLPASTLEELQAPVADATADVERAAELVAGAEPTGLVRQVADARREFLDLAEPAAASLRHLELAVRAVPDFLGAERPRRYFLAAANPAELRGSGGFLGSYAIATFDDGRLELSGFGDLNDLEDVPLDELADSPLPSRYDAFGGGGTWKNLNMTPHFPAAAEAIEELWARTHAGDELDGTIVVDPYALAALVELSGPVTLPNGDTVAADGIVDYVTNEAYAELGTGEERKGVLGEVAGAALLGFLGGTDEDDARASLEVLGGLVADRHLLVHARQPDVSEALATLGATGALPDARGDFVAVVVNSASNAKVDFYTSRALDYRVELLADGRARGELEVTFDNDAPEGGRPQHVLGPNVDGLEVGDNRFLLATFCARTCTVEAADPGITPATLEEELDHPVANTWVEVERGGSETIGYRWEVADAWEDTEGRLVYRLTLRHQVTVRPTTVRVRVALPEGFTPDGLPAGARVDDGAVVLETEVVGGDTTLELRLRP